jgi:hypothetical protein
LRCLNQRLLRIFNNLQLLLRPAVADKLLIQ